MEIDGTPLGQAGFGLPVMRKNTRARALFKSVGHLFSLLSILQMELRFVGGSSLSLSLSLFFPRSRGRL